MDIAQDVTFAHSGAWRSIKSGDGAVTVDSGIITCSADANEFALQIYYIPVLPGQLVEFEVFGLLVSGTAVVAIDTIKADGTGTDNVDTIDVQEGGYRRYLVSYRNPVTSDAPTLARVAMGIPTSPAGEAKFHTPVIRTSHGYGQPIVVASGFIQVVSGTASLHTGFPSFGMSVERTDTNTVTVTLDQPFPTSPVSIRPRVFVSGTTDNEEVPVAGTITGGSSPSLKLKWSSGSAFADVSTGSWYAFVRVEL